MQIACRLTFRKPLEKATKAKISMFCHVAPDQVIGVHDVSSVYHVPLLLQKQGIVQFLQKRLNLSSITLTKEAIDRGLDLENRWKELTSRSAVLLDYLQTLSLLINDMLIGRNVCSTK